MTSVLFQVKPTALQSVGSTKIRSIESTDLPHNRTPVRCLWTARRCSGQIALDVLTYYFETGIQIKCLS
jgi:hypothetical protein